MRAVKVARAQITDERFGDLTKDLVKFLMEKDVLLNVSLE